MIRNCVLVGLVGLVTGCSNVAPWDSGPFCHVVIVKLKGNATPAQKADLLRDVRDLLAPIPTVKGVWAGQPAPTSNLPFVDTNYDVGFCITFGDLKGLIYYNDHPRHVEFVSKYKDSVDVRVFDFSPAGDMNPRT